MKFSVPYMYTYNLRYQYFLLVIISISRLSGALGSSIGYFIGLTAPGTNGEFELHVLTASGT